MHAILVEHIPPEPGETLTIIGDEAHHAHRVKRVEPGQSMLAFDGAGRIAHTRLDTIEKLGKQGWALHAMIESIEEHPPPSPRVEVRTGVPKGPRLDTMIEGLSQAGAADWAPLITHRSVVDPREGKLHRMERIARESVKQCRRAWTMGIGAAEPLERALQPTQPMRLVVADASGEPPTGIVRAIADDTDIPVRILVGPEGGFEDHEIDAARRAGADIVCVGPHVMRIETAAVVVCALLAGARP